MGGESSDRDKRGSELLHKRQKDLKLENEGQQRDEKGPRCLVAPRKR
jgi:hypothetical protein